MAPSSLGPSGESHGKLSKIQIFYLEGWSPVELAFSIFLISFTFHFIQDIAACLVSPLVFQSTNFFACPPPPLGASLNLYLIGSFSPKFFLQTLFHYSPFHVGASHLVKDSLFKLKNYLSLLCFCLPCYPI